MSGAEAALNGAGSATLAGQSRRLARADWPIIAVILLLAFAVRAFLAVAFPSVDHPDEIFQATEQAHRLIFGYGVVPWEFRDGARNWAMPGLVAGLLWPAAKLWASPQGYMAAISIGLGTISLLVVWAAWDIGRTIGRVHAIIAACAAALWVELGYYGVRPLTESMAANFLLLAIALLGRSTPRRLFLGGVALGLAFVFRFHLALALAVIAIVAAERDWRGRWLPILAGGILPVIGLGILDAATWGMPFAPLFENLKRNTVGGYASFFGTDPPAWYLTELWARWGWILPLSLPLLALGARRKPLLLLVALVVIASHSAIPHKEYRFIVPAIACLVVLAGLGLADVVAWLRQRAGHRPVGRLALPGALVLLALASSLAAGSAEGRKHLTARRDFIAAATLLHADPALCGVAMGGDYWFLLPGYSALHRPVPIYFWSGLQEAGRTDAANAIIKRGDGPPPDPLFTTRTCFHGSAGEAEPVCVYRRPGACASAPGLDLNAVLIEAKW